MISFVAHKETIDLAMQNWINLVALLLCDNNLIKRTVSARVKFYRKRLAALISLRTRLLGVCRRSLDRALKRLR